MRIQVSLLYFSPRHTSAGKVIIWRIVACGECLHASDTQPIPFLQVYHTNAQLEQAKQLSNNTCNAYENFSSIHDIVKVLRKCSKRGWSSWLTDGQRNEPGARFTKTAND